MWKKKNTTASTSGDQPVSTPKKAASKATKEPATPKTKTPRAKKSAAKVKAKEEADEELTPSVGRKRSAVSEEAGEKKKVKVEQDVGEVDGASEAQEEV